MFFGGGELSSVGPVCVGARWYIVSLHLPHVGIGTEGSGSEGGVNRGGGCRMSCLVRRVVRRCGVMLLLLLVIAVLGCGCGMGVACSIV